jgi:hypothetical protein
MRTDRRVADNSDLKVWRDLRLALRIAASLQTSIRHADAKTAALLGVHGGLAASVAESAPSLLQVPGAVRPGIAALLSLVFICGLATTGWQFGRVLAPRLAGPQGQNRFAFPNLAANGRRPALADARRLREEAWSLVSTLAGIAMAKHRHVRRSLLGLAVAALSAGGLQILDALVPPVA